MSKIFTTEEQIIKNIENEVSNNLVLPDYNKLLLRLSCNFTYTGRAYILFCNKFIFESIQLLKNALVLYKKGFFDCAFYSTRQASEVMDNMLFIAKNPEKLNDWKSKGYFPVSRKIQTKLEKISDDFLYIEHSEPLSDEDISLLQSIELEYLKYAKNCHKETNGFISSIN